VNKKAILISSDKSKSGKSTLAMVLARFFWRQNYKVIPFKCGPDYIDTLHLKRAAKQNAYNLDPVLLPPRQLKSCFVRKLSQGDVAVVEGAMGLLDGLDCKTFAGSTYEVAKILNLPVLLILDVAAASFSVAARVQGLMTLAKDVNIIGIILNQIGSNVHANMVRQAIEYHTGLPVLGEVPRLELGINSRHLGIKTALEVGDDFYEQLADTYSKYLQLSRITAKINYPFKPPVLPRPEPKPIKTAYIAYDQAFNFYYQDNLDFLQTNGFELKFFSPLHNEVPKDPDFIYIGGGYPELFAATLSQNIQTRQAIFNFSRQGVPILAECGGMMYLSEGILQGDKFYPMCQVFKVQVEMTAMRKSLGYVQAKGLVKTFYFEQGKEFLGHRFHYSQIKATQDPFVFATQKLTSSQTLPDGFARAKTLACYTHFHFLSPQNILEKILT